MAQTLTRKFQTTHVKLKCALLICRSSSGRYSRNASQHDHVLTDLAIRKEWDSSELELIYGHVVCIGILGSAIYWLILINGP